MNSHHHIQKVQPGQGMAAKRAEIHSWPEMLRKKDVHRLLDKAPLTAQARWGKTCYIYALQHFFASQRFHDPWV